MHAFSLCVLSGSARRSIHASRHAYYAVLHAAALLHAAMRTKRYRIETHVRRYVYYAVLHVQLYMRFRHAYYADLHVLASLCAQSQNGGSYEKFVKIGGPGKAPAHLLSDV